MVDELGEDPVHGARRDAGEISELGGGEAPPFCPAADLGQPGEDVQADPHFLGKLEEMPVDGAFLLFLRDLVFSGHGDRGHQFFSDEVSPVYRTGGGIVHGALGVELGFVGGDAVSESGRQDEAGFGLCLLGQRKVVEMVGCVFQKGAGAEEEIPRRRLLDAGGLDGAGKLVNVLCHLEPFQRKFVAAGFRELAGLWFGFHRDDRDLAVLAELELMGQDEPLERGADVVVGGLKDVDGDVPRLEEIPHLIEYGDAEIDLSPPVECFHPGGVLKEECFCVWEKRERSDRRLPGREPDFLKGQLEQIFIVPVGGNAHAVAVDGGAEKEAEEGGGGAGDREPFRIGGDGFLCVSAGRFPQKQHGVCLPLPAG